MLKCFRNNGGVVEEGGDESAPFLDEKTWS